MPNVFFSYSHKDEIHRDQLEKHLASLKNQGLIDSWHDRRLAPGTDFSASIDTHLADADVVLLLVSSDFLASSYCFGVEMKRALERGAAGECVVIPVIVRPCDWMHPPLSDLLAVPRDGKAITMWPNYDEAMKDVTLQIRRAVTKLSGSWTGRRAESDGEARAQQASVTKEKAESRSSRAGSSLDPLAGLVRMARTTYVCYVSVNKLDTLEASLVAAGAIPPIASSSAELDECLRRLGETATFGRPDRHGLRAAAKTATMTRLRSLVTLLKPHITDFDWGSSNQRPNCYYYVRAEFSVEEIDNDFEIATLRAERDRIQLKLDCSLQHFSHRLGSEDGKVSGGSELSSFMRRRSALTIGTVFVLLSRADPMHFIGSPLFLELDSGVGIDI